MMRFILSITAIMLFQLYSNGQSMDTIQKSKLDMDISLGFNGYRMLEDNTLFRDFRSTSTTEVRSAPIGLDLRFLITGRLNKKLKLHCGFILNRRAGVVENAAGYDEFHIGYGDGRVILSSLYFPVGVSIYYLSESSLKKSVLSASVAPRTVFYIQKKYQEYNGGESFSDSYFIESWNIEGMVSYNYFFASTSGLLPSLGIYVRSPFLTENSNVFEQTTIGALIGLGL